jgi:hypothetical protein
MKEVMLSDGVNIHVQEKPKPAPRRDTEKLKEEKKTPLEEGIKE